MISMKSAVALKLVTHLAKATIKTAADLSEETTYSISYIEQIIAHLRAATIVEATRGPGGGYRLTDKPVSAKDVVEAVESGDGYSKSIMYLRDQVMEKLATVQMVDVPL